MSFECSYCFYAAILTALSIVHPQLDSNFCPTDEGWRFIRIFNAAIALSFQPDVQPNEV